MSHKKVSYSAVLVLALFFFGASAGLFQLAGQLSAPTPSAVTAASQPGADTALLCPTVVDAHTGLAIEGATLVLPQFSLSRTTDAHGQIGALPLPVQADARFAALLPQPWGQAVVLVYAHGYCPTLYTLGGLYTATPYMPVLRLEPGTAPRACSDTPPAAWLNALLQKYAP